MPTKKDINTTQKKKLQYERPEIITQVPMETRAGSSGSPI